MVFCCHVTAAYPDTPQNLQVVSATWESIELQWTPGFDGGYEQEFVVVVSSRKGPIYRSTNSSSIYNVTGCDALIKLLCSN